MPDSLNRKPNEPLGTCGRPVAESTMTVLNCAPSPASPRSAEVRNLSGIHAPSRSLSVTRNGRSEYCLTYSTKRGTVRSTKNSLSTT